MRSPPSFAAEEAAPVRVGTVSVVVPAYNSAPSLPGALDSILAQRHAASEIIVVDDASTDATSGALAPYLADARVRLVRHAVNRGVAYARNTGIAQATGEFIAFLDADDEWYPHHLELAVAALQRHDDLDAVCFNSDVVERSTSKVTGSWFDEHARRLDTLPSTALGEGFHRLDGRLLELFLTSYFVHMQSLVARTDIFRRLPFDETLRRSEDLDWTVRAWHDEHLRLAFNCAVTSRYVRHHASLTALTHENFEKIALTERSMFTRYLTWHDLSASERMLLRRQSLKYSMELSYFARERGNLLDAADRLREGVRYGVRASQAVEATKIFVRWMAQRARMPT